jgi:hypothetical protein
MDDEWRTVSSGGLVVRFTYQEFSGGLAFLTAQIAGHEVVYSVLLQHAEHPFSRQSVERHFDYEFPVTSN